MKARIATVLLIVFAFTALQVSVAGAAKWYWSNKHMEKFVEQQAKATEGYTIHTNRNAGKNVVCAWKGGGKKVYKNGKFKGLYYRKFDCDFFLIPLSAVPDSGGYVDCIEVHVKAKPVSPRWADLYGQQQRDYTCALAGYN